MKILRYVGRSPRLPDDYGELLRDHRTVTISTLPPNQNVTISFARDGRAMQLRLSAEARDLVDIAACVYIADELEPREPAPDGWTRNISMVLPVRDSEIWSDASPYLEATLGTLSGDIWSTEWLSRASLPSLGRHRVGLPRGFDAVCTFSGGIDSFLGAYKLLNDGKKVILVGHHADGITSSSQTELARFLRMKFPGRVTLIQCLVARSRVRLPVSRLPDKCEITHRTRSFLFLALATAVASAADIPDIYIPENGLIAINAPLQRSRIGTLSTRTTHPKYLFQYRQTVAALGIFEGSISNPFLYESKTDMLANADPHLTRMIGRTVSCAHAGSLHWTKSSIHHCGYCVPCIYRRIAMLDTPFYASERYVNDVLGSLSGLSTTMQSDFRAVTAFAEKVVGMSAFERQMLAISHGSFGPGLQSGLSSGVASDYKEWADMYSRWATDFMVKVEKYASANTKRILSI